MKETSKLSSYYTNQGYNNFKMNYLLNNSKRKKMIKPPFKKGLYSYKQSHSYTQNMNNNNFFSYESPNYSLFNIKKEKNNILNILPIEGNSLSLSSLNLNKYKIYNIKEKNNQSENKRIINDNSAFIKNNNLSMNINNNISNNNKKKINNALNNSNSNIINEYFDYFNDCRTYEKESRRMIIELFKLNLGDKNNNMGIKQLLKDNKISLKVLNQRLTQKEYENELSNNNSNLNTLNNKEVFGEAKKVLYLKYLDNNFLSQNTTITTEIFSNSTNKQFNIGNDFINNKSKKKINILNFLLTPRVLNLIEENNEKEKFVFLISFDEIFYLEGKESYIFMWKNMENNEIENEFNIKLIKKCDENKIFRNRFGLKVINDDIGEEFNYEIETPSNEICNNYVIGINYLINK